MRSTFRVLFYLKRNAPKKNGLVPVMCRVTVNGKVSQFSSKLDVEKKSWNVELGRVSGRSIIAQEANRMLDKICVGINKAYQEICDRDNYVTAEKVRNVFLGMGMKHETLLAVFRQHNEDYAKQVGKIKSERSYWKYCTVYNHLSEFIKQRYKVSDIAFIKSILKSGAACADFCHGAVQYGNHLLPDYYGLEMITALAFRKHSVNPVFSLSFPVFTFVTKKSCGILKSLNQSIPATRAAV